MRTTSCIFNERSPAEHVIARLQSCDLNGRHRRSVDGSKGRDREVVGGVQSDGDHQRGTMIALDHSNCMATRYIIMLEPAAGADAIAIWKR